MNLLRNILYTERQPSIAFTGNLDLMFVVDSSASVKYDEFESIKRFIREVTGVFDVGASTQVGVFRYAAVLP